MSEIVVVNSLTLDGVMQAPGRPDEDTRGGFEHGGWAQPYNDAVLGQKMAEGMTTAGPILLGRRTYEDFASVWPHMPAGNPYTEVINNARKYVASTTLKEPLTWNNSTLLEGGVTDAVAGLRDQAGPDIVVLGSGELVRSLARAGLVDRYVLLIHPLVLSSGRRLFDAVGTVATLHLVDSVTTTTGVIIATYQPAGATTA